MQMLLKFSLIFISCAGTSYAHRRTSLSWLSHLIQLSQDQNHLVVTIHYSSLVATGRTCIWGHTLWKETGEKENTVCLPSYEGMINKWQALLTVVGRMHCTSCTVFSAIHCRQNHCVWFGWQFCSDLEYGISWMLACAERTHRFSEWSGFKGRCTCNDLSFMHSYCMILS